MTGNMKLREFSDLLKAAVLEATEKVIRQNSILPDHYTKAEAYRLYGRATVDRWIEEGLLTKANVSRKCIERIKLENVASSSNRITYLRVADR
jgi:hypothetical protein